MSIIKENQRLIAPLHYKHIKHQILNYQILMAIYIVYQNILVKNFVLSCMPPGEGAGKICQFGKKYIQNYQKTILQFFL